MPLLFHEGNLPQSGTIFLIFYASIDDSGRMWCPDCRDVEDHVKKVFESASAAGYIVYVGQKSEWKTPDNRFRILYDVQSIPTISRFKDGKEDGRLVLGEILEPGKLEQLIQ